MKKKIAIALLTAACLTGCTQPEREAQQEGKSMFVLVEQSVTYQVVYHRDTKVMYTISCGTYNSGNFTVMLKPDGKPQIYGE